MKASKEISPWTTQQKYDVVNKMHQIECMWVQNVEICLLNQDTTFLNVSQQYRAVFIPYDIG